jgi:hypothetical protein
MLRKYFASLLLLLPISLYAAGGHYPVDDADVGEPGERIVESWITRVDGDNRELAFLPGIALQGGVGVTAGIYRVREDGESFTRLEPELKYQLPGLGLADTQVAVSLLAGFDDGRLKDWLLNVPLSSAASKAVMLHANAGWIRLRDRDLGDADRLFLGAAGEAAVNDRLAVILQLYREGAEEQPEAQFGFRFAGNELVEHVDLALGRALGGEDRDWFVTLGFTLSF